ncbi:MAG: prepilin-type N-terminal cleavage/methylation domain-containing protein [Gemmatimonadetes bacterium]|nr:prepilin-type N-terminal cleavage/methylation domain-containing protein [Gemmatimonadota bacterium]
MNRKGFTLIELLIVVVIIGILAAIAIPKFSNTKEKAILASMKSDLRNLASAQESYYADYTSYMTLAAGTTNTYYKASAGNSVAITGGTNWSATATNTGSTKTCTMSANTGSADEGTPTCS